MKQQPTDESLLRTAFLMAIYPDPQGLTLRELAVAFEITAERVRQCLKSAGFTQMRKRGPRPDLAKRAAKQAEREAKIRERYFGCSSVEEFCQRFNEGAKPNAPGSLYRAYRGVKSSAGSRGLAFKISFLDYRDAWLEVGGRQFGSCRGRPLVLAMADKEVGYIPMNVGVVDRVGCNATRGGHFAPKASRHTEARA